MHLKEYLKTLDCLIISTHLDESRSDRVIEQSCNIFNSIEKYFAYDIENSYASKKFAEEFQKGAYSLKEDIENYPTKALKHKSLTDFGSKKLTDSVIRRYSRTESLFLTHKDIVKRIIEENRTYVVLEDDATLREDVFNIEVELPEQFDILVIGGQTNKETDNKQYANMEVPYFSRVTTTKNNGHGAYATIYTPEGAKEVLRALESLHTHVDFARKPALCEYSTTYKLIPDLFTVTGKSIRDVNIKEESRAVTKEEALSRL